MRSDDPAAVREQYATEDGLAARASIYGGEGTDARDTVVDALRSLRARRLLEVGCGWGELAARLAADLDCAVVAIDQSPRMVELARQRGVDAHVGDVQALAFRDAEFDAVVAAWMLYHVPDLDRALGELARVLVRGGRLVAVTNRATHLQEMFRLVGVDRWELPFGAENGEELLARHFARVELRDGTGTVTFEYAGPIRAYFRSSERLSAYEPAVPELNEPLVVHRRPVVFVADGPLRAHPRS